MSEEIRPLRRAEYDQLVSLGAFEGEKIELIGGALMAREPENPPHSGTIERLSDLLRDRLGRRARVWQQHPLALTDDSEPEPDIAVIAPGDYMKEHPRTAFLVIEVSFSSVRKDRRIKGRLYAEAGIPEYWLVNIPERVVEVYREPGHDGYAAVTRCAAGETLRLVAFAGVEVRVDEILG